MPGIGGQCHSQSMCLTACSQHPSSSRTIMEEVAMPVFHPPWLSSAPVQRSLPLFCSSWPFAAPSAWDASTSNTRPAGHLPRSNTACEPRPCIWRAWTVEQSFRRLLCVLLLRVLPAGLGCLCPAPPLWREAEVVRSWEDGAGRILALSPGMLLAAGRVMLGRSRRP